MKPTTALTIPSAAELDRATPLSVNAVKQISTLAQRQMTIEDEIAKLNKQLEDKGKDLHRVQVVDLPTAMQEAGVTELTLQDGSKIKVEKFVTGNIKEENRPKAHAWLRKNGFGALVKHAIALSFGMGEEKKFALVVKTLDAKRVPYETKEAVNTQTLRAFVRERLSAGKALPPQIDVTTVPTSKIIRRKNHEA